jgi:hypothetical protein
MNAHLSITGLVNEILEDSDSHRLFSVVVRTYLERGLDSRMYEFDLCFAIPPSEGLRSVPTPQEGSLVQISGSYYFDFFFHFPMYMDSLTLM